MRWATVPICRPCWRERNPGRKPVRVIPSRFEICHFCNGNTTMGIYVRAEVPDAV